MFPIFIRETRNNIFAILLFLMTPALFLFTGRLTAQEKIVTYYADPSSVPSDLPISIKHLTAHVSFLPEKNQVTGTAEFTFLPNRYQIDSIVFYLPDSHVSSVMINDEPVKYHQTGSNLVINPDSAFQQSLIVTHHASCVTNDTSRLSRILISYTATPLAGAIYFIGWKPEEAGKRRQIWAHRPHGWIPFMEGRITVDMFVTFNGNYKVFSNGERMETVVNSDSTITWHYAMKKDHPFFSTALVIGDYDYHSSETSRGVPLEYWFYNGMTDRVATTYKYTEQMFDFFEEEMGVSYPYPVYREAPVIDYMYGAMETTTSTVFGDYMQIDPRAWWQRNYVNVNAHELAHQWFGNYVAHFVNRDVWLTESFGTYYAKMFEKSIYGEDYYQNLRNDEMLLTFEAASKNNYPVGGTQGGVQRIYQKGSLVLGMLRNVMGDREFKDAVRLYLLKYGFNYAETNDFIRCTYDATGKPYNWFFDEWILRGGEPDYKVTDSVMNDSLGNRSTLCRVWQVQEINQLNGLFKMPVCFEVHYTDGSADSLKVWIEKQYTEVRIPNPGKKPVEFVLFDPNRKILKKATFERTFDQLAAQAVKAKNMIDRYDAWVALRAAPVDKKSKILIPAFQRESFWLIRSEILGQLAEDHSPESLETFRQALRYKDANVRKAALKNLNPLPDLLQTTAEEMLNDSSYLNVELALGALCTSFPAFTDQYLELTKDMEGWRGKNIRMKWLELAIISGRKEFLPELISYCSPKYEFETRINAFNLLKKLKYSDEVTVGFAQVASKHWNNKLSTAAKEYLK
ncbi:MAG: M1 family metallopeptidase [Bacteroidales bacterium]